MPTPFARERQTEQSHPCTIPIDGGNREIALHIAKGRARIVVTRLIEEELNGANGILNFESTSDSLGQVEITANFVPGTDSESASIEVQNRIKRVILSTYQAASGGGAAVMQELVESTRAHLEGRAFQPKAIPHPYAFNLFSHNTAIDPETGYNDEETKVIKETRKIFEDEKIGIGVTCVRVPVLRAHCEAITFECERPISEGEVRRILTNAPGVRVVDDRVRNYFPMPIDASGQDDVLVGRIRRDLSDASGHSIAMFAAADQLLKGAALNAIQIAEMLPQRATA